MKLHKVYTSRYSGRARVVIPELVLVMYFEYKDLMMSRLRYFYSDVKEFDRRVTKDDFT